MYKHNFNIVSEIQSELLAAILAKLTIGNPSQAYELNKLLDTLPTDKRNIITQQVMKYDAKADLNNLAHPESNANDTDRFILHSAAEALLPQPPIDWIVNSLFSAGTVSMVTGDPGSKKTYAMLDLLVCIALGIPWLGFGTQKIPVLLVDEESGVRRINRRLGDVMRGHRADANIPLYYFSLARFNFGLNGSDSSEDLIKLEEKIQETKAKFVVIDALADVMQGADENSVKDVQPIFMGLRQVADKTGAAIVVIHHSNRNGGYRGSSAIVGALDLHLKVKSEKESPNIDFTVEKNRDGEPMNFAAVASFENDLFFLSSSKPTPKQEFSEPLTYVLEYLQNNGASLLTDITSHADICSENSAKQAVYKLNLQGLVSRVDTGGAGVKATYDLTESGKDKMTTLM